MENVEDIKFKGFLVGEGRSGTTLLSAILNRHSLVCVTPETHFYRWVSLYDGGVGQFINDYPMSLRDICNKMHATNGWRPDPELIIKSCPYIKNMADIGILFIMFGRSVACQFSKKQWLEKTPNHIQFIPLIDKIHCKAPMVHIVRDGRAVAESLTRMDWASDSFVENCVRWRWTLQLYKQYLKNREAVISVKYEDLVLHPKDTMINLCQFLGIKFEDAMLLPCSNDDFLIETGSQHKNKIKSGIDISNVDLWKNKISVHDQCLAEQLLGVELNNWSYSVSQNEFSNSKRVVISPVTPGNGVTETCLETIIRDIFFMDKYLWLEHTYNLGEKVCFPPKYWVQYEELLPDRLVHKNWYSGYKYSIIAILNLTLMRLYGTDLFFYYDISKLGFVKWRLKKFLLSLVIKNSKKIIY